MASQKSFLRVLGTLTVLVFFLVLARQVSGVRPVLKSFAAPFHIVMTRSTHFIGDIFRNVRTLHQLKIEREILREENIRFKNAVIEMEEYKIENDRLKKMLDFKSRSECVLIPAQIIGRDVFPFRYTAWIDK